jgi:NADH dehydrogenase [ubiquinone] 1 alpha subcomplex assembly factor 7
MQTGEGEPAESPLLPVLRDRIRREGPLRIDAYMEACLEHPHYGYSRKAESIGAGGDFITAPEISQVFGEILGLWAATTWERMGQPAPLRLIELGPGRGALMRDALRAARLLPSFLAASTVHLVEVSPALRKAQRALLSAVSVPPIAWHETLADVPPGPAIVIGNEFLDALPIRQLLLHDDGWRERTVTLGPGDQLQFGLGDAVAFNGDEAPRPGDVAEMRPGEDDLLRQFARRADPVMALFIDYGPAQPVYGDTQQAVREHAYVHPLADPGRADITAHVQFAALVRKARAAGLVAHGPVTQAEFLGQLGLAERAARLMAASPASAPQIETAVQRLMAPAGMGGLFKVLVVRSPQLPIPEPFA